MATIPALDARLRIALRWARNETDLLFSLIRPDAIFRRPIPERHRFLFYIGHLEAFDWNLLGRKFAGRPSFSPELDQLFEFGIDPPEGQLPSDQPSDWPSLSETQDYVARTRAALDALSDSGEIPESLYQIAIEHRLMHAETLAYMLHSLDYDGKIAQAQLAAAADRAEPSVPENHLCTIPAGEATLGRKRDGQFGWDNEFEEQREYVPEFAISRYKVTNAEYLKYVEQGGEVPHFWLRGPQGWLYRGMFQTTPLPLNSPVYVSQHQAQSYASWRGMALPTEAQYHRAAFGRPDGGESSYPWGEAAPESIAGNFDFRHWDPVSVAAGPESASAFGIQQLAGNGWEWTSTVFAPFPGFTPEPLYPGYSANFFDGSHYVLKGASPRTAAGLMRRSFRNWFRPRYPYVYATFHCVQNS